LAPNTTSARWYVPLSYGTTDPRLNPAADRPP
jgi:hypothetical protein